MNNVHLIAFAVLFATGTGAVSAAEPQPPAATVITGSLGDIEGSADYVLNSAVVAGETLYLVLEDAASEVVLRVPRATVNSAALALGQSITLVADGIGWVLQSAGRSIAFVPAEALDALR